MTKKTTTKAATKPAAQKTTTSDSSKIGKAHLVALVAEGATMSKKDAGAAVEAAMTCILESLKAGKTVGLPGLGTLSVKTTAARAGVNPSSGEKIQIPAGKKVTFKVAATLKGEL